MPNQSKVQEAINCINGAYVKMYEEERKFIDIILSKEFAESREKERWYEDRFIEFAEPIRLLEPELDGFCIQSQPEYPLGTGLKTRADVSITYNGELFALYEIKELYLSHDINQSKTTRLKGIVTDIKSLVDVRKICPSCRCFIIIFEVGSRYLYERLKLEMMSIYPQPILKGQWEMPSTKVRIGFFEVNPPVEVTNT